MAAMRRVREDRSDDARKRERRLERRVWRD
jgi:hypothetical protein